MIFGEVHTTLLQAGAAVRPAVAARLVKLLNGERVTRYERPIDHTRSPDLLTGIDCRLIAESGASPRGIGTAVGRVSITGGHVLQASTRSRAIRGRSNRRLTWSHYLARSGQIEIVGKVRWEDLAKGFVGDTTPPAGIDLGGMSARLLDEVQSRLDNPKAPFRSGRTRLRWAAVVSPEPTQPRLGFRIETNGLRSITGYLNSHDVDRMAAFSEDLALHDWLLTTLLRLVERSRLGIDEHDVAVFRLKSAVEHLLHLWMPAARLDEAGAALWEGLERRPGLDRQWRSVVDRIRDQLALHTILALSGRSERNLE